MRLYVDVEPGGICRVRRYTARWWGVREGWVRIRDWRLERDWDFGTGFVRVDLVLVGDVFAGVVVVRLVRVRLVVAMVGFFEGFRSSKVFISCKRGLEASLVSIGNSEIEKLILWFNGIA